jgi:hypothetical protein
MNFQAGWPDVFVKKSPNDHKKSPKKSPNQFFVKFNAFSLFIGVYSVFYATTKWRWAYTLRTKH